MNAAVIAAGMALIFLTAATVSLVLSRASREQEVRRAVAQEIRAHAAQVARFPAAGQFAAGLKTAARIAEGLHPTAGYVTQDSSGNVRKAGDWRKSS